MWCIKLKTFDCTGYFTGIIVSSTSREVGVHPYLSRAYKFKNENDAWNTAKSLKANFKCVLTYEIKAI